MLRTFPRVQSSIGRTMASAIASARPRRRPSTRSRASAPRALSDALATFPLKIRLCTHLLPLCTVACASFLLCFARCVARTGTAGALGDVRRVRLISAPDPVHTGVRRREALQARARCLLKFKTHTRHAGGQIEALKPFFKAKKTGWCLAF